MADENNSDKNIFDKFPKNLRLPTLISIVVFLILFVILAIASILFGLDISRLVF